MLNNTDNKLDKLQNSLSSLNNNVVLNEKINFFGRYYFLPFSSNSECICGFCSHLGGLSQTKSLDEIFESIANLKKANYQALVLPCYFLECDFWSEVIQYSQDLNIPIVLQISVNYFHQYSKRILEIVNKKNIILNFLFDHQSTTEDIHNVLVNKQLNCYFTYIGTKPKKALKLLSSLNQKVLDNLYFNFLLDKNESLRFLACEDIYWLLSKLKIQLSKSNKNLTFLPPRGLDIYEPLLSSDRLLEPYLECEIEQKSSIQSVIKVSIIIPTYNNGLYLKNVIRHIAKQNLDPSNFELIIVDDGSTDQTKQMINETLIKLKNKFNLKYFYFPRAKERIRGDNQFRAGVARNLGVKNSRGEILLFLDSDMLLPEDYLSDLCVKMQTYDVVQGRRLFLNSNVSNELTSYSLIDPSIDSYAEAPYWEKFQKSKDWNTLHNHWKYTCTHSLAVKSQQFKQVGWFRKTFIYYGFEDVDLGFRLAQMGANFFLSEKLIYHLHPPPSESEYNRSEKERLRVLAKTCRIFFLHSLSLDAYKDFHSMINPYQNFEFNFDSLRVYSLNKNSLQSLKVSFIRFLAFFYHPAPISTLKLFIGLFKKLHWRFIWPFLCWSYWFIIGTLRQFRWKLWHLVRWKLWNLVRWNLWHLIRWRIIHFFTWPIRKLFYFSQYQFHTRIIPLFKKLKAQ